MNYIADNAYIKISKSITDTAQHIYIRMVLILYWKIRIEKTTMDNG